MKSFKVIWGIFHNYLVPNNLSIHCVSIVPEMLIFITLFFCILLQKTVNMIGLEFPKGFFFVNKIYFIHGFVSYTIANYNWF